MSIFWSKNILTHYILFFLIPVRTDNYMGSHWSLQKSEKSTLFILLLYEISGSITMRFEIFLNNVFSLQELLQLATLRACPTECRLPEAANSARRQEGKTRG